MNCFVSQPIIGHLAAVIITSRCQRGRRFALIKAAHYRFWTWLAFGLRVVRVTHDVWVRPICTKRVRFDHFLAGTWARRRRIQEGQKSEHGFLRRSDWRPTVLGHTFLVTKNLQRAFEPSLLDRCGNYHALPCAAPLPDPLLGKTVLFAPGDQQRFLATHCRYCLTPYFEGQGHWSDRWISSIRA